MHNVVLEGLKQRLEEELQSSKQLLKKCQKGKFHICQEGKYTRWYTQEKGKPVYISKKNIERARSLATRKYLEIRIEELVEELDLVNKLNEVEEKGKSRTFLSNPSYSELLIKKAGDLEPTINAWLAEDYPRNTFHSEQLTHKSISGNFLRSKAEQDIDALLFMEHIPYCYERPVEINGYYRYPDFTIMHPKTGKLYYWEHLGRAGDPKYVLDNTNKLFEYAMNGITLGDNLICTFETLEHPLTMDTIQKMINMYFK